MSLFDDLNTSDDLDRILIGGEARESDSVEFKTAPSRLQPADRDEAAKDISAFATATGGLLIYGIATADKTDPSRPTALDPTTHWNVDYLLLHAQQEIRHPIPGVRTKRIPGNGSGEAFLLLDVPQSSRAPHQVITTHRYYRRQGTKSEPMSHDLVETLLR